MNEIISLGDDRELALQQAMPPTVLSAEIDMQIATAKRYPRSLTRFRQNLQAMATMDESIARTCHYAIPRDGKTIEGPSIRFAEMVFQTWGNARVATRIVDELEKFIVAQGMFFDLENNIAMTDDVPRRITRKNGTRFDDDMIGVTGGAARSIARRNAILAGVPKALWWDAYVAARRTIVGDVKTLKTKRAEAIAWFKTHGIVESQILAALQIQGLADLGAEQLLTLAGFRTSIEDEGKDPEHLFPPADTKAQRLATPPQEQKQADPNPGGASSPKGDADPVPQPTGTAAPPGTQSSPAASSAVAAAGPTRENAAGAAAPASAPVETFTFPNADAALAWKRVARAELEACETRQQIKELRASPEFSSRLAALHEIDEDAAQGIVGLASDLAEALGDGDGR